MAAAEVGEYLDQASLSAALQELINDVREVPVRLLSNTTSKQMNKIGDRYNELAIAYPKFMWESPESIVLRTLFKEEYDGKLLRIQQIGSDVVKGKSTRPFIRGGGPPPQSVGLQAAISSYDSKAPPSIGEYRLIADTPTLDVYLRQGDKSILFTPRGTFSTDDVKADASLPLNRLGNSKRYQTDRAMFRNISAKYPPSQGYQYFHSSHSLGTAIAAQLKREFPFIREGISFNGAFQPADLVSQDPTVKRLYTDKDFLYKLGGRFFKNVQVIPAEKSAASGFFASIRDRLTPDAVKAHSLSNFKKLYDKPEEQGGVESDQTEPAIGSGPPRGITARMSNKRVRELKKTSAEAFKTGVAATSKVLATGLDLAGLKGPAQIANLVGEVADAIPSVKKIGSGEADKTINFEELKWGTFTDLYRRYKKANPKTGAKNLSEFAKLVLDNPSSFSDKARKKAQFYVNIISPTRKS